MKHNTFDRKILIDNPVEDDAFQGKGHERTAKSLAIAISQFDDSDRSIGLDGPWGSGKSSIVTIAAKELDRLSQSGGKTFVFFTFDMWKSQGTAFRRSFLEHLVSWSIQEFPRKKTELQKIEEKIRGKTRHVTTNNNTTLDWYGVLILLTLPFLPIFYFWAKNEYDLSTKVSGATNASSSGDAVEIAGEVISASGPFLTSGPMLVLFAFLFITLFKAGWVFSSQRKNSKITFGEALSRTLLISAKQYEKQQSTQHIREVDPNDFEFQATLSEIVSAVQGPKVRVVLVLDNIDRLPVDQIDDHWSAIRSIFSRSIIGKTPAKDESITAIVPYDRKHIQSTIYGSGEGNEINSTERSLSRRELFSKTFDEILFVAPPVMSNSREFFEKLISEALPHFRNDDELFRVYLIFSTYMRPLSGHFTPRQIISFINDLTNLYFIHEGKHPLSTVAVYTCYRERISEYPLILTDTDFLDAKIRRLAPDTNIEQNLAALLYNVDSKFALEILLDERISSAAVKDDPKELVELSKSHGFDLRVDDVIREHSKDWIGVGNFGTAILNFSNVLPLYEGAAKNQVIDSLVHLFDDVQKLRPRKIDYLPYFSLFDLCAPERVDSLALKMIFKVLETVVADGKGSLDFDAGSSIVDFIEKLQIYLSDAVPTIKFRGLLANFDLPSDPDFMLGVASRISETKLSLSDFGSVHFSLKENGNRLEEFVRDDFDLSEAAFGELIKSNIILPEKWVEVANSIIALFEVPESADAKIFDGHLGTLVEIWTSLNSTRMHEVELAKLSEDSFFYVWLKEAYENKLDAIGLAHAVFLIKHPQVGKDMPVTKDALKGALTPEMSKATQWFADIYAGKTKLGQPQVDRIVENVRKTFSLGTWLDAGRNGGDPLIEGVARSSLEHNNLPRFALKIFLNNFNYAEELVGDRFDYLLERYASNVSAEAVEKLELRDVPIGVLSATQDIEVGGWKLLHKRVEDILLQTEAGLWSEVLENAEYEACLIAEMTRSVGFRIDKIEFRDACRNTVIKILKGDATVFENEIDFDAVFEAIPENFHNDFYRQCREKMGDVSHAGLALSVQLFPKTLERIISTGDKIGVDEKDNVTRNLLCSALEAGNTDVLDIFLEIGRRKVSDFINRSNQSTKDKVDGAMSSFANTCEHRSYLQQISDLVNGKKETKSLWQIWFPNLVSKTEGDDGNDET